jgi:hypothetical protein
MIRLKGVLKPAIGTEMQKQSEKLIAAFSKLKLPTLIKSLSIVMILLSIDLTLK